MGLRLNKIKDRRQNYRLICCGATGNGSSLCHESIWPSMHCGKLTALLGCRLQSNCHHVLMCMAHIVFTAQDLHAQKVKATYVSKEHSNQSSGDNTWCGILQAIHGHVSWMNGRVVCHHVAVVHVHWRLHSSL